ncbi:MAG: alanyl-tRNA editing protein, partial [Thermoproteales archaeon]|nr:alanyl-tRNA editing protein [Thermoproteales archaeon]
MSIKTKLLFQEDSYLREFETKIAAVVDNKVFLYETAFHPGPSGGLDTDTGWLILPSGEKLEVEAVREEEDGIAHIVKGDVSMLESGLTVKGIIDWERRYRMMRLHTASHVIAALLYEKYGARVTGGHIGPE